MIVGRFESKDTSHDFEMNSIHLDYLRWRKEYTIHSIHQNSLNYRTINLQLPTGWERAMSHQKLKEFGCRNGFGNPIPNILRVGASGVQEYSQILDLIRDWCWLSKSCACVAERAPTNQITGRGVKDIMIGVEPEMLTFFFVEPEPSNLSEMLC